MPRGSVRGSSPEVKVVRTADRNVAYWMKRLAELGMKIDERWGCKYYPHRDEYVVGQYRGVDPEAVEKELLLSIEVLNG